MKKIWLQGMAVVCLFIVIFSSSSPIVFGSLWDPNETPPSVTNFISQPSGGGRVSSNFINIHVTGVNGESLGVGGMYQGESVKYQIAASGANENTDYFRDVGRVNVNGKDAWLKYYAYTFTVTTYSVGTSSDAFEDRTRYGTDDWYVYDTLCQYGFLGFGWNYISIGFPNLDLRNNLSDVDKSDTLIMEIRISLNPALSFPERIEAPTGEYLYSGLWAGISSLEVLNVQAGLVDQQKYSIEAIPNHEVGDSFQGTGGRDKTRTEVKIYTGEDLSNKDHTQSLSGISMRAAFTGATLNKMERGEYISTLPIGTNLDLWYTRQFGENETKYKDANQDFKFDSSILTSMITETYSYLTIPSIKPHYELWTATWRWNYFRLAVGPLTGIPYEATSVAKAKETIVAHGMRNVFVQYQMLVKVPVVAYYDFKPFQPEALEQQLPTEWVGDNVFTAVPQGGLAAEVTLETPLGAFLSWLAALFSNPFALIGMLVVGGIVIYIIYRVIKWRFGGKMPKPQAYPPGYYPAPPMMTRKVNKK